MSALRERFSGIFYKAPLHYLTTTRGPLTAALLKEEGGQVGVLVGVGDLHCTYETPETGQQKSIAAGF